MEISPYLLFWLSVSSFLFGMAVGVLNDLHRLSRILFGVRYGGKRFDVLYHRPLPLLHRPLERERSIEKKRWLLPIVIFVQDVLLFCVAGVGVVLLNFYFNRGQLRLYTPILALIGFVFYYFTIGRLVMLISEAVVFFVRAGCHILFYLLFYPFRQILVFLRKIVKKVWINIGKTIANRRKKMYNISKRKCVIKQAESGFLAEDAFLGKDKRSSV